MQVGTFYFCPCWHPTLNISKFNFNFEDNNQVLCTRYVRHYTKPGHGYRSGYQAIGLTEPKHKMSEASVWTRSSPQPIVLVDASGHGIYLRFRVDISPYHHGGLRELGNCVVFHSPILFDVTAVPSNTSIHENIHPELVSQWPGFVRFGGIQTPCQVAATLTRCVRSAWGGMHTLW